MSRLWLLALAACSFELVAPGGVPADAADAATSDGSPDVDSDADGLSDAVDNCRTIANPDQRDWELDGHGDVCDRCPHLVSPADPDGDGDGVGDACDPRPAVPGDQRVIWQGFYEATEITAWRRTNGQGVFNVVGGVLVQSDPVPGLTLLDSPLDYGNIYFASRMEVVVALAGGQEIGVCGGDIHTTVTQYYCCAINGNGGKTVRAASGWAGTGQIATATPWLGSAAVGALIDVTGTMTATASTCTFAQGAIVSAPLSTLRGPPALGAAVFYTGGTQAKYHYLFVVAIGS